MSLTDLNIDHEQIWEPYHALTRYREDKEIYEKLDKDEILNWIKENDHKYICLSYLLLKFGIGHKLLADGRDNEFNNYIDWIEMGHGKNILPIMFIVGFYKYIKYNEECLDCALNSHTFNNLLVKNFQRILLPSFEVKGMIDRSKSINSSVSRIMCNLKHYKFKERLTYMCKKHKRNLFIVSESYTSKTCGCCGVLNKNLGASRVFNCSNCKITMDRDYNGARNILIKNMHLWG